DTTEALTFHEFVDWQEILLKDSGIPNSYLLVEELAEAMTVVLDVLSWDEKGMPVDSYNNVLQSSTEKLAAISRELYSAKKQFLLQSFESDDMFDEEGDDDCGPNYSWCQLPKNALQVLLRKCAEDNGLLVPSCQTPHAPASHAPSSSAPSRKELFNVARRSALMRHCVTLAFGHVMLILPDCDRRQSEPASRWYAWLARSNKQGRKDDLFSALETSNGRLDWNLLEDESQLDESQIEQKFRAMPSDLQLFALLATQHMVSLSSTENQLCWERVQEALTNAVGLDMISEDGLLSYISCLRAQAKQDLFENNELHELLEMSAPGNLVAVHEAQACSRTPVGELLSRKRAARSPLNELDGEEEDDELRQASPPRQPNFEVNEVTSPVSMKGIAALLRNELTPMATSIEDVRQGLQTLTIKLTDVQKVLEERLGKIERRMDMTGLRIDTLEHLVDQASKSSCQMDSELRLHVQAMQVQFDSLQKVGPVCQTNSSNLAPEAGQRSCTAVLGGLVGLASKTGASGWLKDKLSLLSGPQPMETYIKSGEFRGILFARFKDPVDRDMAVTMLRDAGLKHSGNDIWAKEDLPLELRTAKSFLLGLKRVLKSWGFGPVRADDNFSCLTVGTELVVDAGCSDGQFRIKWNDAWANWQELQTSPDVRNLIQAGTEMMTRSSQNVKGKGAAKGS
ncbi:unnamed protein product, partial [Polarella glacialis]